MMTQSVHQLMGQNRKMSGQCYDTWLFPAKHPIATTLMEAHMDFLNLVGEKRIERDTARKKDEAVPAALINPASDMLVRLIVALMGRDIGTKGREKLDIVWAAVQLHDAAQLLQHISAFSVTSVKDGELTRVQIGMRGWQYRTEVLDAMSQLESEVVYSTGGPPPGYMEAQLGDYCQALKEW